MSSNKRYENREFQISELIRDLERQYPLWPSTFSTCDCERSMARGGGRCALCIEEALSEFIGRPLAWELHAQLKNYLRVKGEALHGRQELLNE